MTKNIFFSIFSRGILVLLSLAVFKLLTIKLSAEEVGKWSLLIMVVNLFSMSLINPIAMYLNRNFHRWYDNGKLVNAMNLMVLLYVIIAGLSVCVLFTYVHFNNASWGDSYFLLLCLVGCGVFITSLNMNTIYYINMLGKQSIWFYLSVATLVIALLASLILTHEFQSVERWMFGQYIGYFILGIAAYLVIVKESRTKVEVQGKLEITRNSIMKLMQFSMPLFLAVGLYWLQFQSYRIFVADSFSLAYLGMFVAGYTVSTGIMGAFESVLQQFFHPAFYSRINSGETGEKEKGANDEVCSAWVELNRICVPLIILTAITVSVLSKPLIHILVDEKFWDGWYFVALGAFVEMCRVIGNMYGLAFHAVNNTRVLMIPHLCGAASILITMPVLIEVFDNTGVALSLMFSSWLYLFVLYKVTSKYLKVGKIDYSYFHVILSALCMVLILSIYELFNFNLVNDLLMMVCGAAVYGYTLYKLTKLENK